jgi:hypothetical protein
MTVEYLSCTKSQRYRNESDMIPAIFCLFEGVVFIFVVLGIEVARQVLDHLSQTLGPFLFSYGVSTSFCQGWS